MLIISKFHDYYDGVAKSAGIDKTIVFRRINTVGDAENFYPTFRHDLLRYNSENPISIYLFRLGFCGKTYHGIKVFDYTKREAFRRKYGYEHSPGILPQEETFCLYDEEARSFLEEKLRKSTWRWNTLRDFFTTKISEELFIKYNTPTIVIEEKVTNTAPKLVYLDFPKVVDPYTAYQEIQMYISGVLGRGEKDTIDVSEKVRLEGHGFDPKWSFRQPENRKTRKIKRV